MNRLSYTMILWCMTAAVALFGQAHPYDEALDAISSGQTGHAIHGLAITERGHPSEARMARSVLADYRSRVDLPEPDLFVFGVWHGLGRLAHRLPMQLWYIVSLMALIGGLFVYTRMPRAWRLIGGLGLLAVITAVMAHARVDYVEEDRIYVVMEKSPLRSSPYMDAEIVQQLFSGQMVQVLGQDKTFYLVQTDTYEEGWIAMEGARVVTAAEVLR